MDDILIVEDDQALSQGIRLGLKGEGRRFVQASTLAHGERALEERVFSLVVLDLNLPDGSGLELLRGPTPRCRCSFSPPTTWSWTRSPAWSWGRTTM